MDHVLIGARRHGLASSQEMARLDTGRYGRPRSVSPARGILRFSLTKRISIEAGAGAVAETGAPQLVGRPEIGASFDNRRSRVFGSANVPHTAPTQFGEMPGILAASPACARRALRVSYAERSRTAIGAFHVIRKSCTPLTCDPERRGSDEFDVVTVGQSLHVQGPRPRAGRDTRTQHQASGG